MWKNFITLPLKAVFIFFKWEVKDPISNHNVSDPPLTFSILFLKGSVLFDYYIPLLSKYPNKRLALSEKVWILEDSEKSRRRFQLPTDVPRTPVPGTPRIKTQGRLKWVEFLVTLPTVPLFTTAKSWHAWKSTINKISTNEQLHKRRNANFILFLQTHTKIIHRRPYQTSPLPLPPLLLVLWRGRWRYHRWPTRPPSGVGTLPAPAPAASISEPARLSARLLSCNHVTLLVWSGMWIHTHLCWSGSSCFSTQIRILLLSLCRSGSS